MSERRVLRYGFLLTVLVILWLVGLVGACARQSAIVSRPCMAKAIDRTGRWSWTDARTFIADKCLHRQ